MQQKITFFQNMAWDYFCKNNGEIASRADSVHTRFVLFEGDIIHSIEESKIPETASTHVWRISYVFKLLINPRQENQSMKKFFTN